MVVAASMGLVKGKGLSPTTTTSYYTGCYTYTHTFCQNKFAFSPRRQYDK